MQMTKQQLKETAEGLMQVAKNNLMKDGHLAAAALLFTPEGMIPIMLELEDKQQEPEAMAFVKKTVAEKNAFAVVMIRDVWVVEQPLNQAHKAHNIRPSTHPERKEAIMLFASTPTDSHALTTTYTRMNEGGMETFVFDETTDGEAHSMHLPEGFWGHRGTTH